MSKLEQFSIQHLSKTKVNTGQSQNTHKSLLNQHTEADIKCVLVSHPRVVKCDVTHKKAFVKLWDLVPFSNRASSKKAEQGS